MTQLELELLRNPSARQTVHVEGDTRTAVAPTRLPLHLVGSLSSVGAFTDRGQRDTFKAAAKDQLNSVGGAKTHRITYGGKTLHSPRGADRDTGMLYAARCAQYKAPGSPRRQMEMFYIRSNMKGPLEVRLLSKDHLKDHVKTESCHLPGLINATLAELSPRCALGKVGTRSPKRSTLVPVGHGDDWKSGWQKNGTRLPGEGVKWSGMPPKDPGDTSVFVDAPIPQGLLPGAGDGTILWQRGSKAPKQRQAKSDPLKSQDSSPQLSPHHEEVDALATDGHSVQHAAPRVTEWPRPQVHGNPWKRIINEVTKKNTTKEDQAEKIFGDKATGMTRPNELRKLNEVVTRIPQQWLHQNLTDIHLVACRIEGLHAQFGEYASNVTSLVLEHNMLNDLPDSLALMTKLHHLGLTSNQFETFPDVIGKCTALEVLSLQCNKLQAIKPSVGYCRNLRALYLRHNPLKKLALSLGALKSLTLLSYDNSYNMMIPPYQVGEAGHAAVIAWLKVFYHNIVFNFRCELRKSYYTPQAAFHRFDEDQDGKLSRAEVSNALRILKIDVKFFEYIWLTLDIDNSGEVDFSEFVENMTTEDENTMKDPYVELEAFMPRQLIEETSALLCANPWNAEKFGKLASF